MKFVVPADKIDDFFDTLAYQQERARYDRLMRSWGWSKAQREEAHTAARRNLYAQAQQQMTQKGTRS